MRLSGVLGQVPVIKRLSAEMAAGRLAHAYLFIGPAGVGRATTARALFKAVNCLRPEGDEPCGVCDSCHRFEAGTHEDFLVVEPPADAASAQIRVDAVREVIHTLGFAPFSGGTRLVLIRDAGRLNPSSANALLKTLEEPPPSNILVLTAQDARELLPTLVSRCRKVAFGPLADEIIRGELIKQGLEPKAAALRTALAAGSLGRAAGLDEVELGTRLERLKAAMAPDGDPAGDWQFAEELVGAFRGARIDREGLVEALDLLALHFRDQAVAMAQRPNLSLVSREEPSGSLHGAAQSFALVRRAQSRIRGNTSPELVVALLLDDLRHGARVGEGANADR